MRYYWPSLLDYCASTETGRSTIRPVNRWQSSNGTFYLFISHYFVCFFLKEKTFRVGDSYFEIGELVHPSRVASTTSW